MSAATQLIKVPPAPWQGRLEHELDVEALRAGGRRATCLTRKQNPEEPLTMGDKNPNDGLEAVLQGSKARGARCGPDRQE